MHRAVAKIKFLYRKWAQKNSSRLKIPSPHHYSNGPSLKKIGIAAISDVGTKLISEGASPYCKYSSFLLDSRIWIPLRIHEWKKCDQKKKRDDFITGFTT